MARTSPTFGALVVASLGGVVGTKYLVGGALALIDDSIVSSLLVRDVVLLTLFSGVALGVVAGALFDGVRWGRPLGIVTFLALIGLSVPAIRAMDPIIVTESVGMAGAVLYLLARRPYETASAASVDEEDSATRIGSTLR